MHQGKLILDATCAPADISYPTDLKLLNQARVHTEKIIDVLYELLKEKIKPKPRTSRKMARKDYLEVAKKRQPTRKQKRKAIKKQLQYLKRNPALTRFFCVFLCLLAKTTLVFGLFIIKSYQAAHQRKQELILLSA